MKTISTILVIVYVSSSLATDSASLSNSYGPPAPPSSYGPPEVPPTEPPVHPALNFITNKINTKKNLISNVYNTKRQLISNVYNTKKNLVSNVFNTKANLVSDIISTKSNLIHDVFRPRPNVVPPPRKQLWKIHKYSGIQLRPVTSFNDNRGYVSNQSYQKAPSAIRFQAPLNSASPVSPSAEYGPPAGPASSATAESGETVDPNAALETLSNLGNALPEDGSVTGQLLSLYNNAAEAKRGLIQYPLRKIQRIQAAKAQALRSGVEAVSNIASGKIGKPELINESVVYKGIPVKSFKHSLLSHVPFLGTRSSDPYISGFGKVPADPKLPYISLPGKYKLLSSNRPGYLSIKTPANQVSVEPREPSSGASVSSPSNTFGGSSSSSSSLSASSFSAPSVPSSSFEAPSTSYGAPSTSYGAPSTSYGAPSTSYGAPSTFYGAPSTSYGAPSTSYGAPSTSYGAPSTSYEAPSTSYGAPSSNDEVPSSSFTGVSFNSPSQSFNTYQQDNSYQQGNSYQQDFVPQSSGQSALGIINVPASAESGPQYYSFPSHSDYIAQQYKTILGSDASFAGSEQVDEWQPINPSHEDNVENEDISPAASEKKIKVHIPHVNKTEPIELAQDIKHILDEQETTKKYPVDLRKKNRHTTETTTPASVETSENVKDSVKSQEVTSRKPSFSLKSHPRVRSSILRTQETTTEHHDISKADETVHSRSEDSAADSTTSTTEQSKVPETV